MRDDENPEALTQRTCVVSTWQDCVGYTFNGAPDGAGMRHQIIASVSFAPTRVRLLTGGAFLFEGTMINKRLFREFGETSTPGRCLGQKELKDALDR